MDTFGYPSLPTKTPGGDEPSISLVDSEASILAIACAFTIIGHLGLPQRSFAPLHARHIHAGGFSTTSIDLATFSSRPVTVDGITLESHSIRRGKRVLRAVSPLKLLGETSVKLFPHSKYTTC